MKHWRRLTQVSLWGLVGVLLPLSAAWGHGVDIGYQTGPAIAIDARFDTGEPMPEAQITVYAPSDPATPWLQGVADEEGQFTFMPDVTQPGTWDVRVRQAGHGQILRIPVGDREGELSGTVIQQRTGYTPAQIILMGASGIWGFVGTASFFWRKQA